MKIKNTSHRWAHPVRSGLIGLALSTSALPSLALGVDLPATCAAYMEESQFADAAQLRAMMVKIMAKGELRSTGSESHAKVIDWVESELHTIPGVEVRSDAYEIQRWQPTPAAVDGPGRSLQRAGLLKVGAQSLPVAGAVPYSLGTTKQGHTGALMYVPRNKPITAQHAGKVIVRPFPNIKTTLMAAPPFALLALLNVLYLTPDMYSRMLQRYDRPFLAADYVHQDLIAAGQAGAAGIIFTFDVPGEQMRGYWDPHNGTHYRLPAVFVGADEAAVLKTAAAAGSQATVTVLAERDAATTRNLIATLPGQSNERITFVTNTDGNTWIQENGVAGMLALARYFAAQPQHCRPRTLEFAFNTAHLHMSREGTVRFSEELDKDYDNGNVAFAFAVEHLGTRELVAKRRTDGGPGRHLVYSGKPEPLSWVVPERHPLLKRASVAAIQHRKLNGVSLMLGVGLPEKTTPKFCYFGGIGTTTHSALVPTMAVISGPWSLWAPSFGEQAVDFDHMRQQLLAVGDTVLALDDVPREELAGPYLNWRALRSEGGATCANHPFELPEDAPE